MDKRLVFITAQNRTGNLSLLIKRRNEAVAVAIELDALADGKHVWIRRPHRSIDFDASSNVQSRITSQSSIWTNADSHDDNIASYLGPVVELHAYAVPEGMDEAAIREDLWRNFTALYPEYKDAEPLEERFITACDCPGFGLR